jgi:hypothetical protein
MPHLAAGTVEKTTYGICSWQAPVTIVHITYSIVVNQIRSPSIGFSPVHLTISVVTRSLGIIGIREPGNIKIVVVNQPPTAVFQSSVRWDTGTNNAYRVMLTANFFMLFFRVNKVNKLLLYMKPNKSKVMEIWRVFQEVANGAATSLRLGLFFEKLKLKNKQAIERDKKH